MILVVVLLAITFTSCKYKITDNKGVVQQVTKIKGTELEEYDKTYLVKIKIEDNNIMYYLYTDQIYTVGDVIQFKK